MEDQDVFRSEPVLANIENLCKDRFSGYLVCATDGTAVYYLTNSKLTAYGLVAYVQREIEKIWDAEDEDEE